MSKLLKVLFVILLLVTIGEAGYYVYVMRQQSQPDTRITAVPTTSAANISPTPLIAENIAYINNNVLPYLQARKSSPNNHAFFVTEINGVIGEFLNKTEDNSYELLINDGNGIKVGRYAFLVQKLENTKFYRRTGQTEVPIELATLKVGDKIEIQSKQDLFDISKNEVKYVVLQ